MCDLIADFFNRIRTGQQRRKEFVITFSSIMLESIANILKVEGYINDFVVEKISSNRKVLKVFLKYFENKPVILRLHQVSKGSARIYCSYKKLPIILNGFGIAIISTSRGIMTNERAKNLKLGGEYIGYIE